MAWALGLEFRWHLGVRTAGNDMVDPNAGHFLRKDLNLEDARVCGLRV